MAWIAVVHLHTLADSKQQDKVCIICLSDDGSISINT